ncbi:response regulator [Methanococcoides vulcani]|uniref:response regulator n=1 Tax=Methanococcoides vulcani TaxID=1353158 RepID=UPI000B896C48|nr:response regulator [Methanococcoides vulcani]
MIHRTVPRLQEHALPKILVVDDNQKILELMEAYLFPDYEVITAYNGQESLDIIKKEEIDLVLLDVMMPDMEGYEVCNILKNDPHTQFTPVIIVSALSHRKDRIKGFEAGADEFLTKPVDQLELKTRIRSLLKIKELNEKNESERNLAHNYLDIAGVMLTVFDTDRKIQLINKKGCEIIGCKDDSLLGADFIETLVPERYREKAIQKFYQFTSGNTEGPESFETPLLRLDGEEREIQWHNSLLHGRGDEVIGVLCSGEDITDRKRAEEALIKAEEIHEKEIHHRIKNNLQIISSLLDLESSKFTDPQVVRAFEKSRDRVHSIAITNEEIYRSKERGKVNFRNYVYDVVNYLHHMNNHQTEFIDMNIESEDILMSFDNARHLGLILNELIMNSFKYAFPDGKGTISISSRQFDDQFTLVVEDDGIGFPVKDISKTDTLGLKLVNELVEQIQGNIRIDGSSGTKYTINFRNL